MTHDLEDEFMPPLGGTPPRTTPTGPSTPSAPAFEPGEIRRAVTKLEQRRRDKALLKVAEQHLEFGGDLPLYATTIEDAEATALLSANERAARRRLVTHARTR
jgi:hypothetical protein